MDNIRKLPDAEFDVMVALWNCKVSPVNTAYLMENVGKHKGWKAPTLISFLTRLEEKGFIHSEKNGKERQYYADAIKDDYIKSVTLEFIEKYHCGSLIKMIDSVYSDKEHKSEELDEVKKWVQQSL